MKKITYLTMVLALVGMALLSGCNQNSSQNPPPTPATTNAPTH